MRRAIIYLCVFIFVQLFVVYAVETIWLMAEGMETGHALKLTLSGKAVTSTPMLITASAIYSVLLLVVFLKARWSEISPNYLRTHPWAVLFWSAVAAMGTVIPSLWLQEQMPALPDIMKHEFAAILSSPWGYLTVCVFAPVVEELVFRGAVLRALLKRKVTGKDTATGNNRANWIAIAISALLFAVIHINPAQMPHAFLLGLLLGWMYARTESITPGIMVHWVNNTIAYVGFHLLPQSMDASLTDVFGTPTRALLSVFLSLGCILLPAIVQLDQRMRKSS